MQHLKSSLGVTTELVYKPKDRKSIDNKYLDARYLEKIQRCFPNLIHQWRWEF